MVNISDVIAERGMELNKMTAIKRGPLPINIKCIILTKKEHSGN